MLADHRLTTFRQLFSWTSDGTSKMSNRKNDWFARPFDSVSSYLSATCHQQKTFSKKRFLKATNSQKRHYKKLQRAFIFKLLVDERPENFYKTVQLDFSWTLKMFNQKYNQFVRPSDSLDTFLSTTCRHQRSRSKTIFFKWTSFQTRHWKKVYCPFDRTSLHLQTAC